MDKVDNEILRQLLNDARKSFADIAAEMHLSKNTVRNRYERMKKMGIIVGSTLQINYKRLGNGCVATLLIAAEPSGIQEIIKQLEKVKGSFIFGPFKSSARINLRVTFATESISELENIIKWLRSKKEIKSMLSAIWTEVWFLPENISLIHNQSSDSGKNNQCKAIPNGEPAVGVDEVDLFLIEELTKNSRLSFRCLARKGGVSTPTAERRFKRLKTTGKVVARIQMNPTKLGYQGMGWFYLSLAPGCDSTTLIKKLSRLQDVVYVMKSVGDYDLAIMLILKNTQELFEMENLITRTPEIIETETVVQSLPNAWPLSRSYTSTL